MQVGSGILFNSRRILGVRALDGRLAGDLSSDAAWSLPGVAATQRGDGERVRAEGELGSTLG